MLIRRKTRSSPVHSHYGEHLYQSSLRLNDLCNCRCRNISNSSTTVQRQTTTSFVWGCRASYWGIHIINGLLSFICARMNSLRKGDWTQTKGIQCLSCVLLDKIGKRKKILLLISRWKIFHWCVFRDMKQLWRKNK